MKNGSLERQGVCKSVGMTYWTGSESARSDETCRFFSLSFQRNLMALTVRCCQAPRHHKTKPISLMPTCKSNLCCLLLLPPPRLCADTKSLTLHTQPLTFNCPAHNPATQASFPSRVRVRVRAVRR